MTVTTTTERGGEPGRSSPMRILVVEDDPMLGDALQVGLRQAGFVPDWISDGIGA